jgi:hypothetical protein
MQDKITIKVDKEVYDMIQALKEILPSENEEKFDDNEVLKMVLGTFMAFIQGEEDNN